MRTILVIASRELRSYFVSPLGFVVTGIFLFLVAYVFYPILARFADISLQYGNNPAYLQMLNVNEHVVRPFFGLIKFIFLLIIPVITMRLLAEDARSGTSELLLTAPVRHWELVYGKFLGGLGMVLVLLGCATIFPLIVIWVGDPDLTPIVAGFAGMALFGAACVAIGLFASSLTDNQIVAALTSFGMLFVLWLISFPAGQVGPTLGAILRHLSIIEHLEDFEKGIIDTTHLVFYLSVIGFSLFLTQRVVESKGWR